MRRLSAKTREVDARQRDRDLSSEKQVHTPPPAKRARGLFSPLEISCGETPSPRPPPAPFKVEFGVAPAPEKSTSFSQKADQSLQTQSVRQPLTQSIPSQEDTLNCTFGEALLLAEAAAAAPVGVVVRGQHSNQSRQGPMSETSKPLSTAELLQPRRSFGLKAVQQSKDVKSVAVHPDGTRIKSASTHHEQKLIDVASNHVVQSRAVTRSHSRKNEMKGGFTVTDRVAAVSVRYG
jgi:hypothetical protein